MSYLFLYLAAINIIAFYFGFCKFFCNARS